MNDPFKKNAELQGRSQKSRLFMATGFVVVLVGFTFWQWDAVSVFAEKVTSADSSKIQIKQAKANANSLSKDELAGHTTGKTAPNTKQSVENSVIAEIFKGHTPVVCGLSAAEAKIFIDANGVIGAVKETRVLAEQISKLVRSNSLREKTLGLYMLAHEAGQSAMESERLNYPGCKNGPECFDKPYDAMLKVRPVNAEPLINLALETRDLNTYSAALYACSGAKTAACNSITFQHWAEMEPDNAAAWLMAASEAEARKDVVARSAALQRAVTAKNYNTRVPPLSAIFTGESVQALSPLAKSSVAATLIEINDSTRFKPMAGLGRHCGGAESINEDRRALCDALATKLVEKDETLLGVKVASTIGERIGWSAERLQPLKAEYSAGAVSHSGELDETMFTCNILAKANQRVHDLLTIGERATLRESIKINSR